MANIKQQIKRIRQAEKDRQRNKAVKSRLKTLNRKLSEAVDSGEKEAAEVALKVIYKDYDSAAGKGIVHHNVAARKKSHLAKKVSTMVVASPDKAPKEAAPKKKAASAKTATAKATSKTAATKTAAKTTAKTTAKTATAKKTTKKPAASTKK